MFTYVSFVYVLICSRRRGRTSNLRFRGAYFLIMLCGFRYYVPYIGWPSLAPPSSAFLSLVTCLDSMAQSIMPVSCLLLLADTSRLTAFLFSVADLTHHVPSRTRSNMLMCSVSERGGELASRRPPWPTKDPETGLAPVRRTASFRCVC